MTDVFEFKQLYDLTTTVCNDVVRSNLEAKKYNPCSPAQMYNQRPQSRRKSADNQENRL
jgi:hypothetical protein